MGAIEKRVSTVVRRTKVSRAIAEVVMLGSIASAFAVAPAVIGAMSIVKYIPQRTQEVKNTLKRMLDQGYIAFEIRDRKKRLVLTPKGSLRFLNACNIQRKPKKWDGKWRMLIFDISEKRKSVREKVREFVQMYGFVRLQDSVFIYPYPTDDVILLMKSEYKLGNAVRYLVVDELENDQALLDFYKLVRPRNRLIV